MPCFFLWFLVCFFVVVVVCLFVFLVLLALFICFDFHFLLLFSERNRDVEWAERLGEDLGGVESKEEYAKNI